MSGLVTHIEYPKYTLRIRVLRPDAEIEVEGAGDDVYTARMLWRDFMDLGLKVKAPERQPGGAEYGIARNLLRKHDKARILEVARVWWQRNGGEAVRRERPYLLAFAADYKTIEAEL